MSKVRIKRLYAQGMFGGKMEASVELVGLDRKRRHVSTKIVKRCITEEDGVLTVDVGGLAVVHVGARVVDTLVPANVTFDWELVQ